MLPQVWLVEDESAIADSLRYKLQQDGFKIQWFNRGQLLLNALQQTQPQLLILDIGLPDIYCFFLHEVMANLQVHPIQYLLVGVALVCFYLLLLALSERLGFTLAYFIASAVCGGLILLYVVLFIVMQSEGNALLLGTGIVFIILATIMVLTRHLDWYQVAKLKTSVNQSESAA